MTTGRINQISDLLTETLATADGSLLSSGKAPAARSAYTSHAAHRRDGDGSAEAQRPESRVARKDDEAHEQQKRTNGFQHTASRRVSPLSSACLPRLSQVSPRLPRTRRQKFYIPDRVGRRHGANPGHTIGS